ncbi:sigma-70 family RNA polymerase sigma factor [Mycobacterium sp.]|jgi:RNA polymerase sigma-70 factor (ECF subfamily)|uniref:sigma-70 family RNA polymerase sigma factor n=1 Tax=Mycobacterium sp. TaxID=1785 RepID=UPI002BF0DF44|nr:sigma-70 family RNA polymerase sigma factor [Mycobacterium sp.]HTH87688.1 sigma-70 family RNA polymerase sigma factor [Mycobacterium sp.]
MDGPDFGELRETLDEHAPALQRYALLVTGDTARAADVVGETMLRARRDPQLVGAPAPSVRASLFITARNMMVDQRRSAGLSTQFELRGSFWPDDAGHEEVNATVDRLLLGDALAQLPADHRAVVRYAYYQGRTTAQIAAELHIAETAVTAKLHYALRALSLQLREMRVAS